LNCTVPTLLIVEDDRRLRDVLVQETQGSFPEWAVLAADSLRSARGVSASQHLDAVFLDLGLPDGDRLRLIGELK
jgi:DNA-binding response OmpR family regulator